MLEGGFFWCAIFGVWSSSSPQRVGADGYSYLIPSHFSVYFLETGSYRMINQLYLREVWGKGRGKVGGFVIIIIIINYYCCYTCTWKYLPFSSPG